MLTPEITQYVQQQLAAGSTANDIRTVLLESGWETADVDQLLGASPLPAGQSFSPPPAPPLQAAA